MDIARDVDGDILLVNGDIQWADNTYHHQRDILKARKGGIRTSPGTGVGIDDYTNDDDTDVMGEVRRQFKDDGMIVKKATILPNGKPEIDAYYKDR